MLKIKLTSVMVSERSKHSTIASDNIQSFRSAIDGEAISIEHYPLSFEVALYLLLFAITKRKVYSVRNILMQ